MKKISDFTFVMAYVLSVSFAALLISIQKELYIDITNCPTQTIQAEVGEFYEVKFDLQAGTSEVTYIFFYFELNGEYYSRLPLAALIGFVVLSEFPDIWVWIGGAIIAAASIYLTVQERNKEIK